MLSYQKLIFFRALGLTTLNSRQDLSKIISHYDSIVEGLEVTDTQKSEILSLLKEIMNAAQPDFRYRSCDLADLLIVKFPEWKKDFLLLKTKTLINMHEMEKANAAADEYISAFEVDVDIAVLKLEALMSMDYETVVGQIEELMEFLRQNMG